MKRVIVTAMMVCFCAATLAVEPVQSLRGERAIDAPSAPPQLRKWEHDSDPVPRQYVQQPPVIPHSIDGYTINKKTNKCLTCHSWANYKKSGATKISLTHFVNRDGVELANVAARRYFCTQCHVPQMQTKPLVENTFQPVDVLRRE